MTDNYLPGYNIPTLEGYSQRVTDFYNANELNVRAKTILRTNPYMAERPEVLWSLASMPGSIYELGDRSAAMYGIQTADTIRNQLERMSPEAQRGVFSSLSPAQQMTLSQQGYKQPENEDDNFVMDVINKAGAGVGSVFGVVKPAAQWLQLDDALNFMIWAGDQPARLYRTIRTLDTEAQIAAFAGAALAVGGAFFTGGASLAGLGLLTGGTLATATTVGGIALAGGTLAGAATQSAITNPSDWWNAFRRAGDGERTFEAGAIRRADEILGDPRLINAARDLSIELPDGITVSELAQTVAGIRERDQNAQVKALDAFASRFADPNTPQHQQVLQGLIGLLSLPQFVEAVDTLQNGKISIGRDFADAFTPFAQGSTAHRLISGTVDAASVIALDPLLLGSKAAKVVSNARFGITGHHGQAFVDRFMQIATREPGVRNYHSRFAEAVNRFDYEYARREAPALKEIFDLTTQHYRSLVEEGTIRTGGFRVEHLHAFITGNMQMVPILQGFGTLRGAGDSIQLARTGPVRDMMRNLRGNSGAFVKGLTDARNEQAMLDILKAQAANKGNAVATRQMYQMFPQATHGDLRLKMLDSHIDSLKDEVAEAAKILKELPEADRVQLVTNARATNARSVNMRFDLGNGNVVDLDGIELLDNRFDGMLDEINRLRASAPEADDIEILNRNILKDFALGSEDFKGARIAGRAVGDRIPGASTFGKFVEKVTTMAPAGKYIDLSSRDSAESIRRFVNIASVADMPEWLRRDWSNMLIWQSSPNLRLSSVQTFYENMLRMGGVDALPEGERLIAEFVNKVHQAYAGGGLDMVQLQDHWTTRALALDEIADGVSIPSFKELNAAMRTGVTAKTIMGIVDAPVVEQFQNKVWKPAVLLRIGFIPRAAGEEMFSFMMRSGIGPLGQEFAARGLVRYRRYLALQQQLEEEGIGLLRKLDANDRNLLRRGPLNNSAMWVSNQMARYNWTKPNGTIIDRFSKFYYDLIAEGRPLFAAKYEARLERIAGAPIPISTNVEETAALAIQRRVLSRPEQNRLAFGQAIDSIVLGNPHSWRRMVAGGVHDDIVRSADRWLENNGAAIMRGIGAANAGPISGSDGSTDIVRTRLVRQEDDTVRQVKYVTIRGERRLYGSGDEGYDNAVHQDVVRLGNDTFTREHILPHLSRILPPNLSPVQRDMALDLTLFWNDTETLLSRRLISELMREPSYDRLIAIADQISELKNQQYAALGTYLLAYFDEADLSAKRIATLVQNFVDDVNSGVSRAALSLEQTARDLNFFAKHFAPNLESMDYGLRNWTKAYVENATPEMAKAIETVPTPLTQVLGQRRLALEANGFVPKAFDQYLPPQLFYTSYDEMTSAISDTLYSTIRDPQYSQQLVGVQGIGDTQGAIDKFAIETHRTGIAQVWMPNPAAQVTVNRVGIDESIPLAQLELDELLELMARPGVSAPGVLDSQTPEIAMWLDEAKTGRTVVLADRNLADSISRALTWDAPNPRTSLMVSEQTFNLTPTSPKGLRPMRRSGANAPSMWSASADTPWQSIRLSEDATYDAQVRRFVDNRLQQVKNVTHSNVTRTFSPRTRLIDDAGNVETVVFRKDLDGNLVPVEPNAVLRSRDQALYNSQGERITLGDRRYFQNEMETGNEVLLELVSPMLADAAALQDGRALFGRKNQSRLAVGYDIPDDEFIQLFNSNVEDVARSTRALPEYVEGVDYVTQDLNVWDRFVRYGFDRVIGPAIDSLARRPMAFHFFTQRYTQNLSLRSWMLDKTLVDEVDQIAVKLSVAPRNGIQNVAEVTNRQLDAAQVADYARSLAYVDLGRYEAAKTWSQSHALAWLRGHNDRDLARLLDRVDARLVSGVTRYEPDVVSATQTIVFRMRNRTAAEIQSLLPMDMKTPDLLAYLRHRAGVQTLTKTDLQILSNKPEFSMMTNADIDTIIDLERNYQVVTREAGEQAAIAAMNDMMPFIDSHEIKTQFAEIGRPFMPFWYAEENFMKRWARTLALEGPQVIRKAQLLYMGLKSAGTIRSDNTGQDWFVWPGSSLLHEAIEKIPGVPDMPVGIMFQSRTDSILPGFNSRVGTPQFGPLVTLPTEFLTIGLPELDTFQREAFGELAASQGVLEQIIPTPLARTYNAIMQTDGNTRLMSAMFTAMAMMEANGQGLPPNANAGQVDDYLRDVRNWARVVVISQAIGGWISPGPLSQLTTNDNADFWGINTQDIPQTMNSLYINLVQTLGIEEGTIEYQRLADSSNLGDFVNPMAFTVGRSESRSGAPLPATELAVKFFDDNEGYLKNLPYATPWLLPVDEALKSPKSLYAYDQQTVNEMRRRLTPEEFLNELKFKEGSTRYFAERRMYLDAIEQARVAKDESKVARLNQQWEAQSAAYLAAHPVFAELLRGSGARDRRKRVIEEMRVLIRDPQSPDSNMKDLLGQAVRDFDTYLALKSEYGLDTSARGRLKVERLKSIYETYMEELVNNDPRLRAFWLGVLRPEASLD